MTNIDKLEVRELLENSEDNGYPVWENDPEDIAASIIEQTGFYENEDFQILVEVIKEVLNDYYNE
jgi:hypothetical protein